MDQNDTPTSPADAPGASPGNLDRAGITHLMRLLEITQEEEYSCEETFDVLDQYVEMVTDRQEASAIVPIVKHHLDHCPHCHERYEALLQILQSEPE